MIQFEINKQKMIRKDKEFIVDNSVKYLTAKFSFESIEWAELDKYALFFRDNLCFIEHLGKDEECECIVPFEILKGNNYFNVSVYGSDSDGKRVTSNKIQINYRESGFTKNVTSTKEPSKDAFVDIFDRLEAVEKAIDNVKYKYEIIDNIEELDEVEDGVIYLIKKENYKEEPKVFFSPPLNVLADINNNLKSKPVLKDEYIEAIGVKGELEILSSTNEYYSREEIDYKLSNLQSDYTEKIDDVSKGVEDVDKKVDTEIETVRKDYSEKINSIREDYSEKIEQIDSDLNDVQEAVNSKQDVLNEDYNSSEQNLKRLRILNKDGSVKVLNMLGTGFSDIETNTETVQSDWATENPNLESYIQNKPDLSVFPDREEMNYAISSAVEGITGFEIVEVEERPETGEKGVIYVVNNSESENPEMWLYVNGKWVNMGNAPAKLDEFIKREEFNLILYNRLLSYSTHSETEQAISEHISRVNQFKAVLTVSLPTVGSKNTLYIVPHPEDSKIVAAYVYMDGWLFFGGTHLDRSVYAKLEQVENVFVKKEDAEDLFAKKEDLNKYATSEELNTRIDSIKEFNCEIVTSKPTNPDSNTIYIVEDSVNPENYKTYIYRDEWKVIGGNLENYYTKQQIDDKLMNIKQFTVKIVSELPTKDILENTVYLILENSEKQIYSCHIFSNESWKHIGTVNGDFDDYYTKSETDVKFSTIENVDSKISNVKQFNAFVTQTIPEGGLENTLYFVRNSYDNSVFDIYYKSSSSGSVSELVKVGGSNIDLDNIQSLIDKKQDKLVGAGGAGAGQNIKSVNGVVLIGPGNITPSELGVPTKTSDLINDEQYTTLAESKIDITRKETDTEITYYFQQGSNPFAIPVSVPKAKIGNAEVVDNPEGHPAGKYLKITFENGSEVYLPVDSLVGAYKGLKRQWIEGKGDELGKLLNNINIEIDDALFIRGNFDVGVMDEEVAEYEAKKKTKYPYKASSEWVHAIETALIDIFKNKANLPDEIVVNDELVKQLGGFLSSLSVVGATTGVTLKMTCTGLQEKFNDLFEKDEDDGKYKWKDENMKPPKQDKLQSGDNFKFLRTNEGEGGLTDLLNNAEEPAVINFNALEDKPTINGYVLRGGNNTLDDLGIQRKLVIRESAAGIPQDGIILKEIGGEGNKRTQIRTYVPDGESLTIGFGIQGEDRLKVVSGGIKDSHIQANSLKGYNRNTNEGSIALNSITGGSMVREYQKYATGHLKLDCINSDILQERCIQTRHLHPDFRIHGSKVIPNSVQGDRLDNGAVTSDKIRDQVIGYDKLSRDAINDITKEVGNNINMGDLLDSTNQPSPRDSFHFTTLEREKLRKLNVFSNEENINANPDDIVFKQENDTVKICLNPNLRNDLMKRAKEVETKLEKYEWDYKDYKNHVESVIRKVELKLYNVNLEGEFKTYEDEVLTFLSQINVVNVVGSIETTMEVTAGTKICDVPVSCNPIFESLESQLFVSTNITGYGVITLQIRQHALNTYGLFIKYINFPNLDSYGNKIPAGVVLPINFFYNVK